MTYPVYIGDRSAGTMTVTAAGQDTVFELRCPDPEPGLWRAWVQGEEGRLDLGPEDCPLPLPPGAMCRREGRQLRLALPYGEGRPFPLTELFCLARIRTMDGRRWAEYRFLGRDPVPPEEK